MTIHKYQLDQTVELIPSIANRTAQPGTYTIERLLPPDGRDPQYRVRHTLDGHERAVGESELFPPRGRNF
jgi:hypothetical protein